MEEKARAFATAAHASINHKRKYDGRDYIVHPTAVVELVRSVPHTEIMLCAGWLHDVVEDTPVTLKEIHDEFGLQVAEMVGMLTDVSRPEDGNRNTRKTLDRLHAARASPEAKTVKLADLIDNTRSIVAHDPDFARIYLKEKRLLLEVLKEGDSTLWNMAYRLAHQSV